MSKAKNKLCKLRTLRCVICQKTFERHIAPSEIKVGKGKVCSRKCKGILNGLQKRTGEWRKCERCGKPFWAAKGEDRRGYVRKYCSRKCFRPTKRGEAISTDGYYVINAVKVHRTVMEKKIGRKLSPREIVHHINGDKLDNRIENLMIVTRSEHNRIHKFFKSVGGKNGKAQKAQKS